MTNAMGASVTVIEWGAICTSIIVPDAGGNMDDVALGFDSLEKYIAPHGCFGDTVGRYGNRIGGGKFSIDGKEGFRSLPPDLSGRGGKLSRKPGRDSHLYLE